jgi:hypothetical protein
MIWTSLFLGRLALVLRIRKSFVFIGLSLFSKEIVLRERPLSHKRHRCGTFGPNHYNRRASVGRIVDDMHFAVGADRGITGSL